MNPVPLLRFSPRGDRHAGFLAILPRIVVHANIRFRRLRPDRKEEAIAETVAAAFAAFSRLAQRRKLKQGFASTVAEFAARHVAEDRHVGGSLSSRDAMSKLAQRRRRFRVRSFNAHDHNGNKPLVADQGRFSPADAASFNIDFSAWLKSHPHRHRRIIAGMAGGEGTFALADQFGLSRSRISQLRREYEQSWLRFQGEAVAA
jgi:hypothetical protein